VTVVCADALGPVTPRTFPPPPGWSADGHRITVPLAYGRGPEQVWGDGALRGGDGQTVTLTARSRNTAGDRQRLEAVAAANPAGAVRVITDNLARHKSPPILDWRAAHPRSQQVFIPVAACWLNVPAAWWRLFRRAALAGQSCANDHAIDQATTVATAQLNRRAKPWVWGRPPQPRRSLRRLLVYRI
jgi:hypothetical protein